MAAWLIILINVLITVAIIGLVLLVAPNLIARLRTAKTPGTRIWPEISRLWRTFFSNFTISHSARDITETFRLLFVAMLLFGACLLVWSVGAAVLRAGYLVVAHPVPVPPLSSPPKFPSTWRIWSFLVLEVLRATGGIAALCFAGGLIGGLLGFLFGLPRAAPAGSGGTAPPSRRNWQTSTNLTDISDWLTKIIIGVGLVTATQIWGGFLTLTGSVAVWLFNARHGSPVVIPAAIIGSHIWFHAHLSLYGT